MQELLGAKRILFTGQSGIQSDILLQEFCEKSKYFNEDNRPKYIKVEDRMYQIYCDIKGYDKKADPNIWIKLLQEPISEIIKISSAALSNILTEIENETRSIFLYCHACFYHLQTLE